MTATSFAHEYWVCLGSPVQFAKSVSAQPHSAALSFIMSTNPSSLPPTASASATQLSFAEQTTTDLISEPTGYSPPLSKNTCEPPIPAALSETRMLPSADRRPSSIASNTRFKVITLHTLAMGSL